MQKYRSDIDGLRALAVGAVVLYHCGFIRFFPGGFVGVDVFFVLSGFLITGIVLSDVEKGRFSLLDFYNRRIRRIFPALFAIYAAVLALAFLLFMPSEVEATYKNVISSIFFVSNVFFYFHSGYFDGTGEGNPVLHTWSLSVEEQFYIFLPILVFYASRLGVRLRNALFLGLFALSLVASIYMVMTDQSAAFYLVQYRTWELLAGSLLAMGFLPPLRNALLANILSLIGMAAVLGSIFFLNNQSPFPGLLAVPTVLGTALMLYANANCRTFVGLCLSLPPVRFVGLVSYSFYLWHWPVWVFVRQVHEPTGPVDRLLIIVLSFGLAIASWWFIERPFRGVPQRVPPRRVVSYGLMAMTAGLASCVALPVLAHAYWRVSPQVEEMASFANTYDAVTPTRANSCFLTTSSNSLSYFRKDRCLGLSSTKPNVLLLGDSHAAHFYPGLANVSNINVLQATASGCKPIVGSLGQARCTDLVDYIAHDFLPKHRVDTIIVGGRWEKSDIPGLLTLLEQIKPYAGRVVVMGPIVEYDIALPKVLAKGLYASDPRIVSEHRRTDRADIDAAMREAVGGKGYVYVSTYDIVCPNGDCVTQTSDGKPIQFDYGHLTTKGAEFVISRAWTQIFGSLLAESAVGD